MPSRASATEPYAPAQNGDRLMLAIRLAEGEEFGASH
jgi:hypothetical protein